MLGQPSIKIIIPASGTGTRLGAEIPKQFLQLGGEPILKRTLSIFDSCEAVTEIAIAIPTGYEQQIHDYGIKKLKHVITGKPTRAESVYAALQSLQNCAPNDIILVHDGIRPFVTLQIITAVAQAAQKHGAAVACSPVTDTIKQTDNNGKITATPNRSTLWQAQTPQGFTYAIISRAYDAAAEGGYLTTATDDSFLAEKIGIPVYIVQSPPDNIKITTPMDLQLAKLLIKESPK